MHLSFGVRGLSFEDDDRFALGLLSTVLGEGMSSRLFMRLREELGLCYDIHSFIGHLRDARPVRPLRWRRSGEGARGGG